MLGQPQSMLLPEVIGFKLKGPNEGRGHLPPIWCSP